MKSSPDYNYTIMSSPALLSFKRYVHGSSPKTCRAYANADMENNLVENLKNLAIDSNHTQNSEETDESPQSKQQKRVKFADSVGLELVQIRHMTAGRDTPPDLDPSIFAFLNVDNEEKPAGPTLTLDFPQPVSNYSFFRETLEGNKVALESISINDCQLVAAVKVKNISFHKKVFLRITYDNWSSFTDVDAYYVNNSLSSALGSAASATDTFSVSYEIPCNHLGTSPILFAVCFQCNGDEYWDNNRGRNYRILVNGNLPVPGPRQSYLMRMDSSELYYNTTGLDRSPSEFAVWKYLKDDSTPYW